MLLLAVLLLLAEQQLLLFLAHQVAAAAVSPHRPIAEASRSTASRTTTRSICGRGLEART
jgi:hypothetical protein